MPLVRKSLNTPVSADQVQPQSVLAVAAPCVEAVHSPVKTKCRSIHVARKEFRIKKKTPPPRNTPVLAEPIQWQLVPAVVILSVGAHRWPVAEALVFAFVAPWLETVDQSEFLALQAPL